MALKRISHDFCQNTLFYYKRDTGFCDSKLTMSLRWQKIVTRATKPLVVISVSFHQAYCAHKRRHLVASTESVMYSLNFKKEQAHDDGIWCCALTKPLSASATKVPDEELEKSNKDEEGTEYLVTGGLDDVVKVWAWRNEQLELRHKLEGHALGIISVDVDPSLEMIASSSLDSTISLWNLRTGDRIRSIEAGPVDAWSVTFTADSSHIVSGSHAGKINLYGVESGKQESSLDTRGKFTLSIACSPDGKYVACGAIDGIINVFDLATGKILHTLEGHAMPIRGLCFSSNSQLLLTASDDGHIKIYDVHHAHLVGTLSGHASWVLSVSASIDNVHFASSSSDQTVKVWDLKAKSCLHTFKDHSDQVWNVRYNSEGNRLVSVSDDKSINVYDCPI